MFFGLFRGYHWMYPKYFVSGESMNPTFWEQEVVQVKAHHQPERFDVVVMHPPNDPDALYLKRVVGLPGERIDYQNGQLFVNSKPVTDEFAEQTEDFVWEQINNGLISKDYYFVLGDNRMISKDSRIFGLVPEKQILGIVTEGNKDK
ncbi:signal peptidase I [Enterococcus sp. 669A]|uniref:Signal peptidase I n=1 Tax=Candidatus Enterococcus moelleringii TaxID=2815325 RepID=A0ABS3L6R1_9ENTE|nr:signal peptidase I [Enterococcus sp. 669A]